MPLDPHPRRPSIEPSSLAILSLLSLGSLLTIRPWQAADPTQVVGALLVLAGSAWSAWRLGRGSASVAIEPGHSEILLERLAALIDDRERNGPAVVPDQDLADALLAIADRRWSVVEAFVATRPDHPEHAQVVDRLASEQGAVAASSIAEMEAAQAVNDPERVLECSARLAEVLPSTEARAHEQRVAKWFLALIMKRLRGGQVPADLADLASRVADRFPGTVEGASLRASLPTLRRSAGLCPRCAGPYRGVADACPDCLKAGASRERIAEIEALKSSGDGSEILAVDI